MAAPDTTNTDEPRPLDHLIQSSGDATAAEAIRKLGSLSNQDQQDIVAGVYELTRKTLDDKLDGLSVDTTPFVHIPPSLSNEQKAEIFWKGFTANNAEGSSAQYIELSPEQRAGILAKAIAGYYQNRPETGLVAHIFSGTPYKDKVLADVKAALYALPQGKLAAETLQAWSNKDKPDLDAKGAVDPLVATAQEMLTKSEAPPAPAASPAPLIVAEAPKKAPPPEATKPPIALRVYPPALPKKARPDEGINTTTKPPKPFRTSARSLRTTHAINICKAIETQQAKLHVAKDCEFGPVSAAAEAKRLEKEGYHDLADQIEHLPHAKKGAHGRHDYRQRNRLALSVIETESKRQRHKHAKVKKPLPEAAPAR